MILLLRGQKQVRRGAGLIYLMKLASKRSSRFGTDLMMPISINKSAASLLNVRNLPSKNFWFAALSC